VVPPHLVAPRGVPECHCLNKSIATG